MFKQVANKGSEVPPDEDKNGESCILPFAAVIHVEHFMFTEKIQILEHLQLIAFLIRIFMPILWSFSLVTTGRQTTSNLSLKGIGSFYGTGKYLQGCPI